MSATMKGGRGAWPEDVFSSFLALTREDPIKATVTTTPGDLATPLLERMRRHEAYKRLAKHPEFQGVLEARKRHAKTNDLFADPLAELRLVRQIAMIVGEYDPTFKPRHATLKHQRKVLMTVRKLRGLLRPGAQPSDIDEMVELGRLLGGLDDQLTSQIKAAERTKRRSKRADRDAAQRWWIGGFCASLIRIFGEAPPNIVRDVAGMIGYTPDESTIVRYVKRAKAAAAAGR